MGRTGLGDYCPSPNFRVFVDYDFMSLKDFDLFEWAAQRPWLVLLWLVPPAILIGLIFLWF
jgi:hypothetical protein